MWRSFPFWPLGRPVLFPDFLVFFLGLSAGRRIVEGLDAAGAWLWTGVAGSNFISISCSWAGVAGTGGISSKKSISVVVVSEVE